MKKAMLLVVVSAVFAISSPSNAAVVVFDESLPGIGYGEDSGSGYEAGATPDDGITPNTMQFPIYGSVSGDITLVAGNSYKVTARRKVITQGQLYFDVFLAGSKILRDSAMAASPAEQDTFQSLRYPGVFKPAANTVNVALSNGGPWLPRVDWIKFEPIDALVFDESTSGLTLIGGSNSAIAYQAGASPDDGSTSNAIFFLQPGGAYATLNFTAGKTYKVTARRMVQNNHTMSFSLNLGGINYMWDNAYTSGTAGLFEEKQYLGYYKGSGAAEVRVYNGGSSVTRFDYLQFDATTDVYFDETTPDLAFTGSAGFTPVSGTLSPTPTTNGIGFGGADTVSGTVTLVAGRTYNVYASRTVHDSGNLGYDMSFNGVFFARDAALLTPNDSTIESPFGQYVATNATTTVQLSNGGPWAARVDYIRFELVEPLACGDAGTVYLPGDLYPDCKIDFNDFAAFAQNWLHCTDPAGCN